MSWLGLVDKNACYIHVLHIFYSTRSHVLRHELCSKAHLNDLLISVLGKTNLLAGTVKCVKVSRTVCLKTLSVWFVHLHWSHTTIYHANFFILFPTCWKTPILWCIIIIQRTIIKIYAFCLLSQWAFGDIYDFRILYPQITLKNK